MFNLGLFSKYRTELMGIAAILIILCHMPAHGVVMPGPLAMLLSHGGAGCDIFLFLSGLGMYCSLNHQKTTGGGIVSWYKKRYVRLLAPYFLICIPVLAVCAFQNHWTIGQYFLRLSTLSFWTEGWGLWFVALIVVLYLITPLLDVLLKSKKWSWTIIIVLFTWLSGSLPTPGGVLEHILFCLCRVPSYLLGYSLAPMVMEEKQVKTILILAAVVGMYVLSQVMGKVFGIPVSVFWLEGIILLILFACVIEWSKQFPALMKGLGFMGTISLESYCTNVFLLPFFLFLPWQIGNLNLNPGNWTYYLVGTAGCIFVSYWVNRWSKPIIKQIVSYGS